MKGNHRLAVCCWALFLSVLALPALATDRIRPSALAGSWYPADSQQLSDYIDGLLDAVKPETPAMPVRAVIVPHAAYPYSGATAAQVFAQLKGRRFKRVLVLAPSHYSGFRGLSIANVDAYRTPLGDVPLDAPAVAALRKSDLVVSQPAAHVREHAVEIELPFLQRVLTPGWRLVPVLVGQIQGRDYQKVADLLRPLADEHTLIVISSDFTHFGPRFDYVPFAVNDATPKKIRALDDGAIKFLVARDASGFLAYQERTGDTICGYRALALLLNLLPADARLRQIAYATSGELTGDWNNSVSYVGMVVTGPTPISGNAREDGGVKAAEHHDLVLLQRLAVLGVQEAVLGSSKVRGADIRKIVDSLPQRLKRKSGAFVTLWHHGQLRGCVGYVVPYEPLYQAVWENGFNAARNDTRFMPVSPDELGGLEVEVSALSKPRPIDSYREFRVGEEGVILTKRGHRAVFLPEVATEQGWSREETLSHLALKAGLRADDWRNGASLQVFTSAKYTAPYLAPGADSQPLSVR